MAASRKSGGSNVTLALSNLKRRSGGAWVTATIAKRRSGGAWVDIFPATVNIIGATINKTAFVPNDSVVSYTLTNAGLEQGSPGGSPNNTWLLGGAASDYEVRATQVSDTTTGADTSITGTLNTWLNLGTTRGWSVSATSDSQVTSRRWVLTVEVRRVSDGVVLDSATVDLTARTEV